MGADSATKGISNKEKVSKTIRLLFQIKYLLMTLGSNLCESFINELLV